MSSQSTQLLKMLESLKRTFYQVFFFGYVPYSFTEEVLSSLPQHWEAMQLATDNEKRKEIARSFGDSMKDDEDRRTYQIMIQPMAGAVPFDLVAYQARFAQFSPEAATERERKALLSDCFVPLPLPSQVALLPYQVARMKKKPEVCLMAFPLLTD